MCKAVKKKNLIKVDFVYFCIIYNSVQTKGMRSE